jgi:NAD(P)-dependent dehydrogenase (short-subunit alcohol dehydrogenase family)
VVLITGAAGTIGRAAAEACLAIGAKVVLSDVRAAEAFSMANILKPRFGLRVGAVALNLRDVRSIRSAVRKVLDNFGRIDSLVCNAATFSFGPLETQPSSARVKHYEVGLEGHIQLIKETWRRYPESKSGSVICISSVAGHIGEPNAFAYTPIKAGLKGVGLACSIEMAQFGGWAVTLSPGHTWSTPHRLRAEAEGLTRQQYEDSKPNIQSTMFGRFLEPEQVGTWIAYLASPFGKPLTGQDVHLTNGIEAGGFNRAYNTSVTGKKG